MSKVCKECGGTGMVINNKFCKCADGKLKKAMASAKDKAHELLKQAAKKAAEDAKNSLPKVSGKQMAMDIMADPIKNMQTEWANHFKFGVGDWVEHGELIGIVDGIDMAAGKIRFIGYKGKGEKPAKGLPQGWIAATKAKLAPVETFKNENQMLIDLALDTKDYDWLYELTGGKSLPW